jgi:DNA (cytosine-5)-methyltransferase 3A
MNVLSLFDGISCGYEAFKRANIKVDKYYASEIDKYAIQVAMKNHPDIIQLGDVRELDTTTLPKIDLLIGGSPCQNMSTLGNRKGLKGEKSCLFYEYYRVLQESKPKYFLLENNANMPKKDREEITKLLGVEPIMINSSLVSAQNRKRLYWTNIPNVQLPEDKNIELQDVILAKHGVVKLVPFVVNKLSLFKEKYGYIPKMFNPYNLSEIKDKCPCLTAEGNSQTKSSSVIIYNGECYTMLESGDWEIIQTIPIGYTECLLSESKRKTVIGNAWTVDVISHIFSFMDKE